MSAAKIRKNPKSTFSAEQYEFAARVATILEKYYPGATCSLNYQSAWQLLVATILSAQTTDVRVNETTPFLFRDYPDAAAMAAASITTISKIIKPLGFFQAKANYLVKSARMIQTNYHGQVPRTIAELVTLPGVGRKTAAVVLGNYFQLNEGFPVDTHVLRVSQRLGLTIHREPGLVEKDLICLWPVAQGYDWSKLSLQLIYHGRQICHSRKPACGDCPFKHICPAAFKV